MLNLEAENAANKVVNTIIRHNQYNKAMKLLEEHFQRTELFGVPNGIAICGISGSGKTSLIEKFRENHQPTVLEEKTIHPVIFVEISGHPDIKQLYLEIIYRLGNKPPYRPTERDLRHQAVTLLKEAETRLIVADEVQHFVERYPQKNHAMIADCFKSLMSQTNVSIAFLGLPSLGKLLQANTQLRRRFSESIELKPWDIRDESEQLEFCDVLKTLFQHAESGLQEGDFDNDEVIASIYFATNGCIAYMVKIVAEAIRLSMIERKRSITREYLERAFKSKIWSTVPDLRNPFHRKFNGHRLINPNEPFEADKVFLWS